MPGRRRPCRKGAAVCRAVAKRLSIKLGDDWRPGIFPARRPGALHTQRGACRFLHTQELVVSFTHRGACRFFTQRGACRFLHTERSLSFLYTERSLSFSFTHRSMWFPRERGACRFCTERGLSFSFAHRSLSFPSHTEELVVSLHRE